MLNVLFITTDHPFYNSYFFKEFDKNFLDTDINIVGYALLPSEDQGKKQTSTDTIKRMIAFYGWFDFIRMGSRFAFYKVMNKIALQLFNGKFPGCFSVQHYLLKKNHRVLHVPKANAPAFIQFLKDNNIDILVSIGAAQIFRKSLLTTPKYGVLNLHHSLLPEYRGLVPSFWALLNYDKNKFTGSTVFKMNEGVDTGGIILQEKIQLDQNESLEQLIERSRKHSAVLVYKSLLLYKKGEPHLTQQDESKATYFGWPDKESIRNFREKNLKLI